MNTVHRQAQFWRLKSLQEMSKYEWESLCDGCARCCLLKLEDPDSSEVFFTNVSCRLLNTASCRCSEYTNRARKVPGCLVLNPDNLAEHLSILPPTCAYKRIYEGQDLPDWHPLITGSRAHVHAWVSVRGRCISEPYVHPDQLPEHIVDWPQQTEHK